MFDYQQFFRDANRCLHRERRYRRFHGFERDPGRFPVVRWRDGGAEQPVTVWCSNDYLGMSQHPAVLDAARRALEAYGAGAGGTRNISGTHALIAALEEELAAVHAQQAALVFSSGYVANDATLATLAAALPDCVILSDSANHASMIEGMRRSRAERRIFPHNDADVLDAMLAAIPVHRPRLVAFESLYSMDGDFAPLAELLGVARRHGALTFVDETHAAGVYGGQGGGLCDQFGVTHLVDVLQGGLGKGYGVVGGFIAGSAELVDFIRSHAAGFIFTTALPPAVAAGALASVRHLRGSHAERAALFRRVGSLRAALHDAGLPLRETRSQILPLIVGDPGSCQAISEALLRKHGVYLQAINYPTVPRGTERLRITPTPLHSDNMAATLISALADEFARLPQRGRTAGKPLAA